MSDKNTRELWTAIEEEGFENLYEVSNLGRVRKIKSGKIMKLYNNGKGYMKVDFMKDGKRVKFYVHRLVAKAFLDNPNGYSIVNHKDENPLNNCADNLEWCTLEYNLNYGTAKERKILTRLMDKGLIAQRNKLQREVEELTLKKLNYIASIDSEIEKKVLSIEKIDTEIEEKKNQVNLELCDMIENEEAPEAILATGKFRTSEEKKLRNKEYYQKNRESILANYHAKKKSQCSVKCNN